MNCRSSQANEALFRVGRRAIGKLRVVRAQTLKGYRTDERHVVAAIGRVRLDRLSHENIEHLWSSTLDRGLKVGHCRRTLHAARNGAVKRGLIGRNPVATANMVVDGETDVVPYTVDQMTALEHRLGQPRPTDHRDGPGSPPPASTATVL
jgi:hypothetical protein